MSAVGGEVWFYHLQHSSLEHALSPLLEKCLARGWRALVRGVLAERIEALDQALWAWPEASFLPHGVEGRVDAARQPVLLTTAPTGAANGAHVLFLVDGAPGDDAAGFARTCVMFDGADADSLASARARWTHIKKAGGQASYWKETSRGRWEKQG